MGGVEEAVKAQCVIEHLGHSCRRVEHGQMVALYPDDTPTVGLEENPLVASARLPFLLVLI